MCQKRRFKSLIIGLLADLDQCISGLSATIISIICFTFHFSSFTAALLLTTAFNILSHVVIYLFHPKLGAPLQDYFASVIDFQAVLSILLKYVLLKINAYTLVFFLWSALAKPMGLWIKVIILYPKKCSQCYPTQDILAYLTSTWELCAFTNMI